MAVQPPIPIPSRAARPPSRIGPSSEAPVRGARRLRERCFRALKAPLVGRYAVRWRWPPGVERERWERVMIPSASGAALAGVYARAPVCSKGVVVCVHPLRKEAKGFFLRSGRAELLLRNGYDVLAFDLNGFGESTGGDFRYACDVLAAGRFAAGRAEGRPVHVLAACFGAVWTLGAAMREPPFGAIVIESPLASLHEYYARTRWARAVFAVLWRTFPRSAADARPLAAIARLAGEPRVLLVAGLDDTLTPPDMARRMYDACTRPGAARRLWYVEGAQHLRAFETAPRAYERQVIAFLDDACPASALIS